VQFGSFSTHVPQHTLGSSVEHGTPNPLGAQQVPAYCPPVRQVEWPQHGSDVEQPADAPF
jgi:hypothetical protein